MTVTLPFLDDEANREWVLRIERAREPEEQRYRQRKGEITADFVGRGLHSSTAFLGALRDEELNHLRELIRIGREELFAVVEARNIRLSDEDVNAVTAHFQDAFRRHGQVIQDEQRTLAKERGLPSIAGKTLQMLLDQAMHQETVVEVSLRAIELRRKQEAEAKTTAGGSTQPAHPGHEVGAEAAPMTTPQLSRIEINVADILDAARTIPVQEKRTCSNLDADWVSCNTYITWARRGLAEGDDCGLSNCVVNAKRAVCRRIDALLRANHVYPFMSTHYPERMEALTQLGIDIPGIVHDLVISPRNVMEHDYDRPNADAAKHALQLADLLLRATQDEYARKAIVALNWGILGGWSVSEGKMAAWFRAHGREPMLFIDVFEEPRAAKIVDGANKEVRYAHLDSFRADEAIELAKILRQHYSGKSRSEASLPAFYYEEMKRQGGF